ncbi:hypothetical protein H1V43_17460 [Streptomyces sp. PSKA54]|uniref:DNA topoisomerase IB N-terminal domain-containing protein n=1 Tax=Streptomyces himalayensis subsp. aureolus TaxID=2758039 RepID=A0A7W2D1U3_9ACTN|nr:hypothetical protein [Streptomyces himalayensis]MBA4863136.1 hypothetical protein [Streptomyces himalayensis subsp. aureolus]
MRSRHPDTTGAALTDPDHLAGIRALAIRPAWRDVWVCPWPGGNLQAVGVGNRHQGQGLPYLARDRARHVAVAVTTDEARATEASMRARPSGPR